MPVGSLQMRVRFSAQEGEEDTIFSTRWLFIRLECEHGGGTYYLKEEARADASPYIGLMLTNDEVSHIMAPKGVRACQE